MEHTTAWAGLSAPDFDAVAWVNAMVPEVAAGTSSDAGEVDTLVSSTLIRLQLQAQDCHNRLDAHMTRVLAALPRARRATAAAVAGVEEVSTKLQALASGLPDGVREMAGAGPSASVTGPPDFMARLEMLDRAMTSMERVKGLLQQVRRWERLLREVESSAGGEVPTLHRRLEHYESMVTVAAGLQGMPDAGVRSAVLSQFRADLLWQAVIPRVRACVSPWQAGVLLGGEGPSLPATAAGAPPLATVDGTSKDVECVTLGQALAAACRLQALPQALIVLCHGLVMPWVHLIRDWSSGATTPIHDPPVIPSGTVAGPSFSITVMPEVEGLCAWVRRLGREMQRALASADTMAAGLAQLYAAVAEVVPRICASIDPALRIVVEGTSPAPSPLPDASANRGTLTLPQLHAAVAVVVHGLVLGNHVPWPVAAQVNVDVGATMAGGGLTLALLPRSSSAGTSVASLLSAVSSSDAGTAHAADAWMTVLHPYAMLVSAPGSGGGWGDVVTPHPPTQSHWQDVGSVWRGSVTSQQGWRGRWSLLRSVWRACHAVVQSSWASDCPPAIPLALCESLATSLHVFLDTESQGKTVAWLPTPLAMPASSPVLPTWAPTLPAATTATATTTTTICLTPTFDPGTEHRWSTVAKVAAAVGGVGGAQTTSPMPLLWQALRPGPTSDVLPGAVPHSGAIVSVEHDAASSFHAWLATLQAIVDTASFDSCATGGLHATTFASAVDAVVETGFADLLSHLQSVVEHGWLPLTSHRGGGGASPITTATPAHTTGSSSWMDADTPVATSTSSRRPGHTVRGGGGPPSSTVPPLPGGGTALTSVAPPHLREWVKAALACCTYAVLMDGVAQAAIATTHAQGVQAWRAVAPAATDPLSHVTALAALLRAPARSNPGGTAAPAAGVSRLLTDAVASASPTVGVIVPWYHAYMTASQPAAAAATALLQEAGITAAAPSHAHFVYSAVVLAVCAPLAAALYRVRHLQAWNTLAPEASADGRGGTDEAVDSGAEFSLSPSRHITAITDYIMSFAQCIAPHTHPLVNLLPTLSAGVVDGAMASSPSPLAMLQPGEVVKQWVGQVSEAPGGGEHHARTPLHPSHTLACHAGVLLTSLVTAGHAEMVAALQTAGAGPHAPALAASDSHALHDAVTSVHDALATHEAEWCAHLAALAEGGPGVAIDGGHGGVPPAVLATCTLEATLLLHAVGTVAQAMLIHEMGAVQRFDRMGARQLQADIDHLRTVLGVIGVPLCSTLTHWRSLAGVSLSHLTRVADGVATLSTLPPSLLEDGAGAWVQDAAWVGVVKKFAQQRGAMVAL